MHLTIKSADELGKILSACAGAAGGRGDANPIQTALLLIAEGEQFSIVAVDSNSHQLKKTVTAKVLVEGRVLIPPGHFSKMVSRMGKKEITIKVEGSELVVSSGLDDTFRYQLYQASPADFPYEAVLPEICATVDGDALNKSLKYLMPAVLQPENEITFKGEAGTLSLYVGEFITVRDRFQLLSQEVPFLFGVQRASIGASKMPAWSGVVNIHFGNGLVVFSQGSEHLVIKNPLADTDVEGLDVLVTMEAMASMVVSAEVFADKISMIAYDKQIVCNLTVTGKTDKFLVITSENAGATNSRMQVPIQGLRGKISKDGVSLDAVLVDKSLSTVEGDDVRIDFLDYTGDQSEIFIRFSNDANPDKRQTVLVPLQVT